MNYTQSMSISELRQDATNAVNKVIKQQEPMVIMKRSHPKAVLVDIAYYQALEEAVLDLTDAQEAERAKKEPRIKFDSYLQKRWGTTKL